MIKRIFIDLDECVLHTTETEAIHRKDMVKPIPYMFEWNGIKYTRWVYERTFAKELFEFAKSVVGLKNVFILTTSVTPYAHALNEKLGFGVLPENIMAREDIEKFKVSGCYGSESYLCCDIVADPNNILIDNLPPIYNTKKINVIGIVDLDNYFQIPEFYYGESDADEIRDRVFAFIKSKHDKA